MPPTAAPSAYEFDSSRQYSDAALIRPGAERLSVLVVDGDRVVAEMLSMTLRCEGADVTTANDGASAITAAQQCLPTIVIMDPRLPDMDPMALLQRLRQFQPKLLTVLVVPGAIDSVRTPRAIVVDTWITKPFSVEEAVLSLRRALRRSGIAVIDNTPGRSAGDLTIDEDRREVTRAGDVIELSHREFELLRYLMRHVDHVVTKQQILGRVWAYDYAGQSNIVELYVSYLRKKIDHGRRPMIHTLRGAGYILKSS